VLVEGRFETPAAAELLCDAVCGLDWNPATVVGVVAVPLVVPVVGAVCTEATTPFGPKPGAQVIGPAGMTVVVTAVTVGEVCVDVG